MLITQSCPTLRSHRLWPARLLCPWDSPGKWVTISSPRDLPDLRIEPESPILQADSLLSESPRKELSEILMSSLGSKRTKKMTQKKLSAYGKIILRGTRDNWQLSGFILTSVLKSIELFIPGGCFFFVFCFFF